MQKYGKYAASRERSAKFSKCKGRKIENFERKLIKVVEY